MALISSNKVLPEGDPTSDVWLVGECPGFDEDRLGRPFIGAAGQLLREALRRHGRARTQQGRTDIDAHVTDVYITNVCGYRPANNDFALLKDSWQLNDGILELKKAINTYKPNVVIALGNEALKVLTGKYGAYNHNASILQSLDSFGKTKVVCCLHPANVLRSEIGSPLFDFAIRRGIEQGASPLFQEEPRYITIDPTQSDIDELYKASELIVDIENVKDKTSIRCIGFSHRDCHAVCFRWNGDNYATIKNLLESGIPCIFHFGVHDVTVLKLNGIDVANYADDTIIRAHVIDPELPRKLAVLNYLYTTWPYYKSTGRDDDDIKGWSNKRSTEELLEYCGKDVISQRRVWMEQEIDPGFTPTLRALHQQEMKMQRMSINLGLRGLLVDEDRRKELNELATGKIKFFLNQLFNLIQKEINPGSPKQMAKLMYEDLGLPIRKSRKTGNPTTDEDALVSLLQVCSGKLLTLKTDSAKKEWQIKLGVIKCVMNLREWMKIKSSYIDITLHEGRAKSTWNVPGTETGRWSASNFCDSSGLNLQTLPRGSIEG